MKSSFYERLEEFIEKDPVHQQFLEDSSKLQNVYDMFYNKLYRFNNAMKDFDSTHNVLAIETALEEMVNTFELAKALQIELELHTSKGINGILYQLHVK